MTMKTRAELERENEILREKLAELTDLLEDDELTSKTRTRRTTEDDYMDDDEDEEEDPEAEHDA